MSFPKLPWVQATNIYEVNLRQYTAEGTLAAFRAHLPRLRDMGVETLWFMPITPISLKKRKGTLGSYYASSDYLSVNPEFGTLDEFRSLVSEIHAMGMKVIIDWVANHTGADHVWTKKHPEFFLRNAVGECYDTHGWEDVIDLDYSNRQMREEMKKAMSFWVHECAIDGFRCDMAMLVPVDFWVEARRDLDAIKPLFWLAECDQWDDPVYLEVFDAAYTWKWMHTMHDHYRFGVPMEYKLDVLRRYQEMPPSSAIRAWFTSNHDENSWNGTEFEKYGDLAYPMAVFSCTWDGIPLIYSGQELPNHKRLAFFDKDQIEWSDTPLLHDFFKKLLTLHRTHPAMLAATEQVSTQRIHTGHPDKILCFVRRNQDREVLVMLNFSGWPLTVDFFEDINLDGYSSLFPVEVRKEKYPYTVELPAYGYAVWVK